jgi:hypothetical protein
MKHHDAFERADDTLKKVALNAGKDDIEQALAMTCKEIMAGEYGPQQALATLATLFVLGFFAGRVSTTADMFETSAENLNAQAQQARAEATFGNASHVSRENEAFLLRDLLSAPPEFGRGESAGA